ncbi:MAG: hypothetical protein NT149_03900 [Candidatus Gottesmanbacteria bacterium]|nr:hypothetical protein [Candidatus Gottesmanbacteria bacterium]
MKKSLRPLAADDVRDILDDKLRETGLDQVPKKLDLLDKILVSVDKLVEEIKGYREEQTFHQGKHEDLEERVGKIEKHLHFPATP